jgi:3-dehydroquinate dehydratase / shikimate dehydrogenase
LESFFLFMLIETVGSLEEIGKASADCIEIRLDLMNLPNLKKLTLPYLLTPKSKDIGYIEKLLTNQPPYMDLDIELGISFIEQMVKENPTTKFIVSYHNFEKIPDNLSDVYEEMASCGAFAYKIAVHTPSAIDALKLLRFKIDRSTLSVIAMGERGQFARILAPIFGNQLNFASIGPAPQAPGQLSSQEMRELYRFSSLNAETKIYALIGDPVEQSIGHLYHNQVFKDLGKNCVYVKIKLAQEELADFFALAKELNFKGLSVTMPFKEKVLPYLDEIDPKACAIGAINTLSIENGQIFGTNTDGISAIDAIEKRMPIQGKQVLILGAGGAARSIAHEAAARGAFVSIYARNPEKARLLGYPLGPLSSFDIAINCGKEPLPISFLHRPLVMDINYNRSNQSFLEEAKAHGCEVIDGKEMFFGQAALQSKFWFIPNVIQ